MGRGVDGWYPSPAIGDKYKALLNKHLTEREQQYNPLEKLFKKLGIAETHRALKRIGITGKIGGAGYSFEIAVFDPSIITDISVEPMFQQNPRRRRNSSPESRFLEDPQSNHRRASLAFASHFFAPRCVLARANL